MSVLPPWNATRRCVVTAMQKPSAQAPKPPFTNGAGAEPDLTAVHHRSVGRLVQSPPCVLMPGAVGHEHDHVVATSFGAVTCVRIVGVARAILVGGQILAVADGERSVACQDGYGR